MQKNNYDYLNREQDIIVSQTTETVFDDDKKQKSYSEIVTTDKCLISLIKMEDQKYTKETSYKKIIGYVQKRD